MGINMAELELFPKTIVDEIIQNTRVILTTIVGTVPLDRSFGISSDVIDQPSQRAIMGLTVEIFEAIRKYEPRVEVKNVEFINNIEEAMHGKLTPKVRVRILDEIFENLPDVSFAEKNTQKILEDLIKDFEETIGRKLYPGDPLRILLLAFAKKISLQRSTIDYAGKQNLLKYAREGYLDHIGALVGVTRLKSSKSTTILRFTISQVLPSGTIIPKGTRSTPGNRIYFETICTAEILPGTVSIDVLATCSEAGIIGNGFLPGEVNRIVDPFPFFQSVENTTITQGGADTEDLERLRQRISEAPASFSTAGPDAAYKFWAKSTNQLISDVGVYSPRPGVVSIVPLLQNGELPTDDILEAVYQQCNNEYIRPLTDMVVVERPQVTHYNLELTYYISRSRANISSNIQNSINVSIQNFIDWQKEVLGRDINPSQLIKMIVQSGAKRVEVLSPNFIPIKDFEIAIAENIAVTYGGLEND